MGLSGRAFVIADASCEISPGDEPGRSTAGSASKSTEIVDLPSSPWQTRNCPLRPTTAWLGQLLQAEMADRQARSYEYQLRLARFPAPRDIDSFDFKESAVNETRFRQLYAGDYLTTARNIVLVGGTGTGKSHLATALARHVILAG